MKKLSETIANQICACVPFHLYENAEEHFQAGVVSFITSLTPSSQSVNGYFLMWPLFVVSIHSLLPQTQRRWAQERLKWINTYMGIGQARALAQVCGSNARYSLLRTTPANVLTQSPENVPGSLIAFGHTLQWGGSMVS